MANGLASWFLPQSYGPPANAPNPTLKREEYATPSWAAMKAPDEKPDTEIELGSTLEALRVLSVTAGVAGTSVIIAAK